MKDQTFTELFTYNNGRITREIVPSVPADFDEFEETSARMRFALDNDPQVKALRDQANDTGISSLHRMFKTS
jgi:hypothetical protein